MAAELIVLVLGAIWAWFIHYLYGLDLLTRMLYLFPSPNGLGLWGFLLIPIVILIMLVWAAICVVFIIALLLFAIAVAVALLIVAAELAINMFTDPAHYQDPLLLLQARIRGIEAPVVALFKRTFRRFGP
jgi:hypothetical protein